MIHASSNYQFGPSCSNVRDSSVIGSENVYSDFDCTPYSKEVNNVAPYIMQTQLKQRAVLKNTRNMN